MGQCLEGESGQEKVPESEDSQFKKNLEDEITDITPDFQGLAKLQKHQPVFVFS